MTVAVSGNSPVPDRYITRMNYSGLHALATAGVGIPTYHMYRMASIYDPDLSGVGHQPLGHDELALLYTKYVVTGIRYSVTFTNQSTTDYADVAVCCRPNSNTMSLMSTVFESAYVQRGVVGPETGSGNMKVIRGTMSIAKIRGVSPSKVLDENEYAAQFGASPVIVPTLQIYVENQNVAAAITVNARVDITYMVQLYDRKVLSQS